jgi:hypothetical protein
VFTILADNLCVLPVYASSLPATCFQKDLSDAWQCNTLFSSTISKPTLIFKNVSVGLLVGIGGGAPHLPRKDARLGDVVVGALEFGPTVVQYDLGRQTPNSIEVTRTLNKPPTSLLRVVDKLENDIDTAEDGEGDFFTANLQRFAKISRMRKSYRRPSIPDRLFRANYVHEDGTQCSLYD